MKKYLVIAAIWAAAELGWTMAFGVKSYLATGWLVCLIAGIVVTVGVVAFDTKLNGY